ncbi:hypothetical protein GCM10010211_78580 [Streptomyces albospinus]|uniref:Transposase n=1 Tax=Streptomyces albospinus TaxID=285515 RepID=A0ABQ2VMS0_9ACTN|nr:hypothetical protein GCM10010211_78580 [Streptomyces albospinus]
MIRELSRVRIRCNWWQLAALGTSIQRLAVEMALDVGGSRWVAAMGKRPLTTFADAEGTGGPLKGRLLADRPDVVHVAAVLARSADLAEAEGAGPREPRSPARAGGNS